MSSSIFYHYLLLASTGGELRHIIDHLNQCTMYARHTSYVYKANTEQRRSSAEFEHYALGNVHYKKRMYQNAAKIFGCFQK